MFQPTHWLVSRTRRVPVIVQPHGEKFLVFTEAEREQTTSPAFEMHTRLGMYCRGVQVLGYTLEPIDAAVATVGAGLEA